MLTAVLGEFSAPMALGLAQILGEEPTIELLDGPLTPTRMMRLPAERAADVALLGEREASSRALIDSLAGGVPAVRVIVLAHEPSRAYALRLLSYGVSACISRDSSTADILAAVRLVAEGKQFLELSSARMRSRDPHARERLTPREDEVLGHLQGGASNAEIAQLLTISIETVRSHAARIYRKLEVQGRKDILALGPSPRAARRHD
jgi:DNA-binding NarL/FixJ family response regulator